MIFFGDIIAEIPLFMSKPKEIHNKKHLDILLNELSLLFRSKINYKIKDRLSSEYIHSLNRTFPSIAELIGYKVLDSMNIDLFLDGSGVFLDFFASALWTLVLFEVALLL